MSIDFKEVNDRLCSMSSVVLPQWLPEGKRQGKEFVVGGLAGDKGRSLSINMGSGVWKDFATDEGGSDLISLYADIRGMGQAEAAKALESEYALDVPQTKAATKALRRLSGDLSPGPAPADASLPAAPHSAQWVYHDENGHAIFVIYRHDQDGKRKRYTQWTWDVRRGKYVAKAYPEPRPLYNAHILKANPDKRVLVVEGEKCAEDAARILQGRTLVTTWPGGSKAAAKANWSMLAGRKVTVWPDADEVGIKAAGWIAGQLSGKHGCDVNVLDVDSGGDGWDVSDALRSGWDLTKVLEFAKRTSRPYEDKTLKVESPSDGVVRVTDRYAQIWDVMGLMTNSSGVPIPCSDNVRMIISRMPDGMPAFWWDEYADRLMVDVGGVSRSARDNDIAAFAMWLQREIGLANIKTSVVWESVNVMSELRGYNPVEREIASFKWDGEPRIDTFLNRVVGCIDDEYSRFVSKSVWLSMVVRAFVPGCKVDTMLILEGPQGIGKSQLLRAMCLGDRFSEMSMSRFDPRECAMVMAGQMITEVGELQAFRAADIDSVKQFLTIQSDHFRAPYGRLVKDVPRRGILVGTTNNTEYLYDVTGARRFLPIMCRGFVNVDRATTEREQCYAEAKVRWQKDERWWLDASNDHVLNERAENEQESKRSKDSWEDAIDDYLVGRDSATMNEILVDCLRFEFKHIDMAAQFRVGRAMRALGWAKRVKNSGGKVFKEWVRSDDLGDQKAPVEF